MRIYHPETESLAAYLYSPNDCRYASVHLHVKKCVSCQQTLVSLRKVLSHLKNAELTTPFPVEADHLTKDDFISYINCSVEKNNIVHIQSHLDSCGACMKRLMLYRTRHYETAFIKASDAAPAPTDQPKLSINNAAPRTFFDRMRYVFNNFLSSFFNRFFSRSGLIAPRVSFAAIFLLLISAIVVNQFQDNSAGTNTGVLLPPDVVVNPQHSYLDQAQTVNGINWYQGKIETTAVGTVDMTTIKNRVHAEIVAEKTARLLAYAQMVEILSGIKITSATTFKALLMKADMLELVSEGFIRGAQVVDKKIEWVGDAPKASVTLQLPLFGRDGFQGIVEKNKSAELFLAEQNRSEFKADKRAIRIENYSGIIIDARGIDYEPALYFSVLSQQNEVIFSDAVVLAQSNKLDTVPAYYSQLDDALNSTYAGKTPYIVKAKASAGAGNIMVRQRDASIISNMLKNRDYKSEKLLVVF